ncbi:TIGR00730 family Rossman fold protein [Biformimicrobium ophioploci]|uniref:Cytokinin riboside 5'-monophosphate phosphoribohydrolase n=1 Tax=Biformimicrobium ophioploci TaxID=3036711 RepID=A0ABQ6M082_9GAMM|nr:TIGR00730 family Rossman fold protein [Microbulbifer sp. NKW57]GMG87697.1 LOG family protein [Microbulbifer sp. NKW57]
MANSDEDNSEYGEDSPASDKGPGSVSALLATAAEDVANAAMDGVCDISTNNAYRLAYDDLCFMLRDESRATRLMLEWMKVDLLLKDKGVDATAVFFGSAREQCGTSPSGESYYQAARQLAYRVAEHGQQHPDERVTVVSGGGPGIMEAANRGASEAGAITAGFNIVLPHEQNPNPYITPELCFRFHYFAMRKLHFMVRARALVCFPGGYGTLDELFDALTLLQTRKTRALVVVLYGSAFWKRLVDFDLLVESGYISRKDIDFFHLVDSVDEAMHCLGQQLGWHTVTAEGGGDDSCA